MFEATVYEISGLGIQRRRLGDPDNAIIILTAALKERPTESRIRDILIRLLADKNKFELALEIASDSVLLLTFKGLG
jgi:hypothetical protein